MNLSRENFDEIINLLAQSLTTPRRREIAINHIFSGTRRQPPPIDYEGDAYTACSEIVRVLRIYGNIDDKHATWHLLDYIKQFYGEPNLTRIDELQDLTLTNTIELENDQVISPPYTGERLVDTNQQLHKSSSVQKIEGLGVKIVALISAIVAVVAIFFGLVLPIMNRTDESTVTPQTLVADATVTEETVLSETPITLSPSNTPVPPTSTPDPLEIALARASNRMNSNSEWETWYPDGFVQEFDGVEMVLVPADCFPMGNDPEGWYWNIIEAKWVTGVPDGGQPSCFDSFWIDRYEVSNAQFARFNGAAPRSSSWTDDNLPRERISWYEARDFCELRGGRLPTEAEWEYAARGVDRLLFPWGNDYDAALLNDWSEVGEDSYENTAPVTAFVDGISWVGAYQMSGNVWEWVSTIYAHYPYNSENEDLYRANVLRGLRGGSWENNPSLIRAASRNTFNQDYSNSILGVRCARDI